MGACVGENCDGVGVAKADECVAVAPAGEVHGIERDV